MEIRFLTFRRTRPHSMSSVSVTKPEVPASAPAAKPRKKFPLKRALAVLLLALLVCLLVPSSFQFVIRQAAIFTAHQHGIDLEIDKVQGSIFEPVAFYGIKVTAFSAARTATSIEITRADVDISLASLVFKRGVGCLRSVSLDGLEGKIKLQPGNSDTGIPLDGDAGNPWVEKLIPSRLNATHVNLLFQRGNEFVQLQNLSGLVSDREPGTVQIDKLIVNQSWLAKTFSSVKGATAFQDSRISIANLSLENNLTITNASSDLMEMGNGRLKVDFDLAAFDGSIRGEMRSASASLNSPLEANGEFSTLR